MFSSKWPRRYLAIFYLFFLTVGCEYILLSPQMLAYADSQQGMTLLGVGYTNSAPSVTPVVISDLSWNSLTSSFSVGALATGTGTGVHCNAFIDCIPLGNPTITGNLEILAGAVNNTNAVALSATDAATLGGTAINTYTCATGTAISSIEGYLCYKLNATSGAIWGRVQFGSSGSWTGVVGRAFSAYNVTAIDGTVQSCAGTSTTAPGCASLSPTQANDLLYVEICPVSAPAITSFTPGTGFTSGKADLQTGCTTEYEVDSGTGSITPAATFGAASSYTEIAVAFASGTQGSAPTGRYLAGLMSYSTTGSVTEGTVGVKFPNAAGNLLVDTNSCNTITVAPSASITAWSITSNVATFTAANTLVSGQNLILSGFGTSTFFNGQVITVLSTGLSGTQFEANFSHANGSATENGSASSLYSSAQGTWTTNSTQVVGSNNVNESYVINATADSSGAVSIATSGTGDCTHQIYEFAGAPTSGVVVTRAQFTDQASNPSLGFSGGTETESSSNFYSTASSNFNTMGTMLPVPSNGLTLFAGSQFFNTSTDLTGMGSSCLMVTSEQGGENRDGPWPTNQNNPFGYCNTTGTPLAANFAFSQTSTSQNPQGYGFDAISFASAGDVLVNVTNYSATTGTTQSITIPATTSGDLIQIAFEVYGGASVRTFSSGFVGTSGTPLACPSGAHAPGVANTVATTYSCYLLSAPSGATTVSVTMSGAANDFVAKIYEWNKPAGGSWVADGANATTANGGTGSGNNLTSPSVSTTGSPSVCAAAFAVDGQGLQNAIPASGGAVYGGYIGTADRNGMASWMGTGSATAVVSDQTSADSFNSSIGCAK